ncbi:nucleotide sugar dehydrogenase [Hyalangium sp.]|uniref:nucleotide sugar dehydrogenase n=1 Tax=Hyalangium sp. TaxID=2028555 RepID=UPI002D2301A6|nr:nucleotide sugar dehydrogenase [Hyalangium sp.]HYH95508.1 nucleotide sugar dehydrogenase [Hyalangium sp.]
MRLKVAIIGGCGHVGLPLALAFAPHHDIIIYDINAAAVEQVKRGEMPFRDDGGEQALKEALARGLIVTTSPEHLSTCDILIAVIGTPVDEHLNPSFAVFDRLLGQLDEVLKDGQTLVLRSTVYPGSSERVQRHFRQRGRKVEVAFCPERVAEGVALKEIRQLPQIISGFSPEGVKAARDLFSPLGVELIELAPLEAELAKLFTNVYRYISFAVANQFYMVASEWNLDPYRILQAMKKDYPRAAHLPMPGFAAGPCLFKDTMQMSAFNNNQFFLGHSAMLVNEGLPQFVVHQMLQRWPDLGQKKVGILGMAFKAESDDTRESLSYKLKKILELHASQVLTCDPYVENDPRLRAEQEVLEQADLFVIGAPHKRYKTLDFRGKPVVDVWNHLGHGGRI